MDLILAVLALAILSPLLAIISVLVLVFVGSPVVFRQVRCGYKGYPFVCLKFRTMSEERDENGRLLPDELRLTHLGKFLRRTSLDELPELINVLRGEMSLVGPRPLLIEYLERYTPEQARRHDVPPGITGWAQVHGRNASSWNRKLAHDIWYVKHRHFWLDVSILLRTIWMIVKQEGISRPGYATTPEFTGMAEQNEEGKSS